jgi:Arc/MetJ-type ribon-helix-helix transcriptional regulator
MHHIIEQIWGMKIKTSITLSSSLITAIDEQAESFKNRSEFIEAAVRAFLAQRQREARESRDLAIIAKRADRINAETAEVLEYQVIP